MEVTPMIENLISNVRNSTVHTGDIAADGEAYKNFVLMDKLIRDIIIAIIKYKGYITDVERQFKD
jgi:hypothetical protein